MAVDITLLNSNSLTNIQNNFERVETALQDAVSRSGNTPNQMNADLDMNSNDILNVDTIQANDITVDGTDATGILQRALEAVNLAEMSADDAEEYAQTALTYLNSTTALLASTNLFIFDTKALAQAFNPVVSPNTIFLSGNLALGDLGYLTILNKVGSQPSHLGKLQIANGTWYELNRYAPINPFFFQTVAHGTDHSLAFSDTMDVIQAYGGGYVQYPHRPSPLIWNTALTKTLTGRIKFQVDFGSVKIQTGSALFLGGTYALQHMLTIQGGASIDISANITQLYSNFAIFNVNPSTFNLRVGDRIYISDSVNTWAAGDGRPCSFATVDFVDTTNNIINFYPPISIPITVTNATTGQLSTTGIVMTAYPDDMDMYIKGGNFYGARHPAGAIPSPATPGQVAGGSSPFGLLFNRGKGTVDGTGFYDLCTSLRFTEGSWNYINSQNQGSYNGYGVKINTRAHITISNCIITGSRHAVGIGGSHPDGATGFVVNSTIGGDRLSFNANLYPGDEFGPLDMHPSAIWGEVHNCNIIGGFTHDNGHLKIIGSRIYTRQLEGIGLFPGNASSGGSFSMIDTDIEIHPRVPAYDGPGESGSFGSSANLFRESAFLGTGTDWTFLWKGGSVRWVRGNNTWVNPTDFVCNLAQVLWYNVEIDGVKFYGKGTTIRRILFNARSDTSCVMIVRNCLFERLGALFLNEPNLDDVQQLIITGNRFTRVVLPASVIEVQGDTSSTGSLQDVVIKDNYMEMFNTASTAFITMSDVARRSVVIADNVCIFAATSGTMTRGIRSHRNQNATGQHNRFNAVIRGNLIMSNPSVNTITTGIEVLGLAVSGSLVVGFYYTGDNIVSTATTPTSFTGTLATGV